MKFRNAIAVGAALVALTACSSTTKSYGPVKALPSPVVDVMVEAAFAETIADECRSLRYNTAYEEKVMIDQAIDLISAGYTDRDLDYFVSTLDNNPQLEARFLRMVQARKINITNEASWCAAGKREKARGTAIGRYLV